MIDKVPEVVLLCGPAGSGKTTYAQDLERGGHVRLAVDELIWSTFGRYGVDYPPERYAEHSASAESELRTRLRALIAAGRDVVVDSSLWDRQRRADYKHLVHDAGGRWRLIHLRVPEHELRRRLARRAARFDANAAFGIDDALLAGFLESFQTPDGEGEEVLEWLPGDTGRDETETR